MNTHATSRSKTSPPQTPEPEHRYGNNSHSSSYSTSSTPGSEKRQRKTLLIQKQRQLQNSLPPPEMVSFLGHGSNNNHLSTPSTSPLYIDASETAVGSLTRTTSANSRSSTSSTVRYPRMRRFVTAMGMIVAFCVLVMSREQNAGETNKRFQFGTARFKTNDQKEMSMPEDSDSHDNPMEALGGIPAIKSIKEDEKQSAVTVKPTNSMGGMPVLPREGEDREDDTSQDGDVQTKTIQPKRSTPPRKFTYTKPPYDPAMELQEPQLPADSSNDNSFVKKYCDLQGSDWFPIDKDLARNASFHNASHTPKKSWQQRAPFVLLLGPPHAGSDIVYQLLSSHPQIATSLKSQFFTYNYKLYVKQLSQTNTGKNSNSTTTTFSRVKTRSARQAYMARHVSTQRQLQKNPSQIVLDNVPETLLYEQIMAPFVLCAMPWSKWVITVSHPIRRLLLHYRAARSRGLLLSLEDWIARDLERMQQAGLILQPPQNTTAAEFEQQARQTLANHDFWITYQELTTHSMEASAGQSLYEAMIHPWFTWMEQTGRRPSTEIVMVQKEILVGDENSLREEYQRILQQLGLMPHTPPAKLVQSIVAEHQAAQRQDAQEEDAVRRQLKRFFQPYNRLFDQFLRSYYPPEVFRWKPELWKKH